MTNMKLRQHQQQQRPQHPLYDSLKEFLETLKACFPMHVPFTALYRLLPELNYEDVSLEISDCVFPHLSSFHAKEDEFILSTLNQIPVLSEMKLYMIWNPNLDSDGRKCVWCHLEHILKSTSKDVAEALADFKSIDEEKTRKRLGFLADYLPAGFTLPEEFDINPLISMVRTVISEFKSAKEEFGEDGEENIGQHGRGGGAAAGGATTNRSRRMESEDTNNESSSNSIISNNNNNMLSSLHKAISHPEVRKQLRILIVQVAPVLRKLLEKGIQSTPTAPGMPATGGKFHFPSIQKIMDILDLADSDPLAPVLQKLQTTKGAQSLLSALELFGEEADQSAATRMLAEELQIDDISTVEESLEKLASRFTGDNAVEEISSTIHRLGIVPNLGKADIASKLEVVMDKVGRLDSKQMCRVATEVMAGERTASSVAADLELDKLVKDISPEHTEQQQQQPQRPQKREIGSRR